MSEQNIPVEGHDNLERDPKSNAILNRSKSDFIHAKTRARKAEAKEQKLQDMEAQIEQLNKKVEQLISHIEEK